MWNSRNRRIAMLRRSIMPTATALVLANSAPALAVQPPDAGQVVHELQIPAPIFPGKDLPPLLETGPAAGPAPPAPDSPRIEVKRFTIVGAGVFGEAELLALIQDGIGKEYDLAGLNRLAARISAFYREHGYLLALAYLPAQEIRDGEVKIAVLEGRIGQVSLKNNSVVADGILSRQLGDIKNGDVVRSALLERSLLLLGDTPGVEVKSTLKPGASVGTSDLVVDVAAGSRVTGSVDFDTYGNRYTGQYRLGGTLNVNNPLDRGDRLSLRVMDSDENLAYGRVAYQAPIDAQGTQLGAAHSGMRYRLGKDFVALQANGSARIDSLYALHPFVRSRGANLYGQLSFERKTLEDRIDSTGTVTDKNSRLWTAGLSGDSRDGFGGGGANTFSFALAGGKLAIASAEAKSLDDATAGSSGNFAKANLSLARVQALDGNFALYGALQGQWASKNLDSSEKFSLGGSQGVRAYPQGEAGGDEGWLANVELRYALNARTQLQGFVDRGHVDTNKQPWTAGSNSRTLGGYGLGVLWSGAAWIAKADIAWRAGEKPVSDVDRSPRVWLQVIRYFQ